MWVLSFANIVITTRSVLCSLYHLVSYTFSPNVCLGVPDLNEGSNQSDLDKGRQVRVLLEFDFGFLVFPPTWNSTLVLSAFSIATHTLWNSLPVHICASTTLDSF